MDSTTAKPTLTPRVSHQSDPKSTNCTLENAQNPQQRQNRSNPNYGSYNSAHPAKVNSTPYHREPQAYHQNSNGIHSNTSTSKNKPTHKSNPSTNPPNDSQNAAVSSTWTLDLCARQHWTTENPTSKPIGWFSHTTDTVPTSS